MNYIVGTRYFKAPELILEFQYYNYGVDIWSVGCIFASILFRKNPFILGNSLFEILITMLDILGGD